MVPKGRRAGLTQGASQFCVESLLDQKTVLWVDTVQLNLESYFHLYFLPLLMCLDRSLWAYRAMHKDLVLCGTKMDFRSAERPENIEGFAYNHIILNEAGIILKGQRGRNLWYNSIYPMVLDHGARVWFVGTPKGKRAKKNEMSSTGNSLYYELAQKGGLDGHKKEKNYKTLTYSSYDNPKLQHHLISEMEADVPSAVRRQEIHGEFIDAGDEEIFKSEWFNIVEKQNPRKGRLIMSLDTAFKKGSENDCSACVVMQETASGWDWVDMFNEKLEFPGLIKRTVEFYKKWSPDLVLIEDKASGQSLLQMFKQQTSFPVMGIRPDTDKLSRAQAVTPLFETGKVRLMRGPWNQVAINQLCEFNALMDTMDDIVDAVSQLLNYSKKSLITVKHKTIPRRPNRSTTLQGY